MGAGHHHHLHSLPVGRRLAWAVVVNLLLTLVQLIGGLLSGSLSLIADALHNLSDAGALVIAYMAQRISGLPANHEMTFGYGRAEILGALINSVALVVVGVYLMIEAIGRFQAPKVIDGWMVIAVATVALLVDLVTAWLTSKGSKHNINLRAAFIHNISDAMASVVVIISGVLILTLEIYWVDLVATIVIALYVFYHSIDIIKSCLKTLMQAVPKDIDRAKVVDEMKSLDGVLDVHHVHIWAMHDRMRSLEAHIRVSMNDLSKIETLKGQLKNLLCTRFQITHSTLEFEPPDSDCSESEKK